MAKKYWSRIFEKEKLDEALNQIAHNLNLARAELEKLREEDDAG